MIFENLNLYGSIKHGKSNKFKDCEGRAWTLFELTSKLYDKNVNALIVNIFRSLY